MNAWDDRGEWIRRGNTRQCLGNLSIALQTLGNLNAAEYNGASGTLSLLPTAGALIGAPTKEICIVYKLMPLAGIHSMFMSLGGTITPSQAGEYDMKSGFDYGGMMPTRELQEKDGFDNLQDQNASDIQKFANKVVARALDDRGDPAYVKVWIGVGCQLYLIMVILVVMWYGQRGGVIVWWCRAWGWMYFWYFLVVVTSVFDNVVAAPFKSNITMRVCRAPTNIKISRAASSVINPRRSGDVLDRLKTGVTTKNRLTMNMSSPSTMAGSCFYVGVSEASITGRHAFFQIVSNGCTVSVFAFGTMLFASASLISVSAALMLLAVILSSGVLARVVAMWMASEMNKHSQQILHQIVHTRDESGRYVEEIQLLSGNNRSDFGTVQQE